MQTLCERLNMIEDGAYHNNAISIDRSRNIDYYKTLWLYCAENHISLTQISDIDFENTVDAIRDFGAQQFNFWIDK